MCAVEATTQLWMSGRGYAERNLLSFFANSFGTLDHFKVNCKAEELAQGLHLVFLMKDTGLEKDCPASSVPRVYYEPPTSSTSEVGLLSRFTLWPEKSQRKSGVMWWIYAYVTNGKWSIGLSFVVARLAHAYYRMGWPCFQKTSCYLDCIFVQGLMKGNFHTGRGKSFLQCEFIGSRWTTQILRHSMKLVNLLLEHNEF